MKTNYFKLFVFILIMLWLATCSIFIVAAEFEILLKSLFLVSFFGTSLLIFLKRVEFTQFIKGKFFKQFAIHMINFNLIVCILGVINYLVYKHNIFHDFTISKIHTLSRQSKDAVSRLVGKHEVSFELFAAGHNWDPYINLLELYKNENKNIKLMFYDIEKEIGRVSLHNITEEGTLVITYKGKSYKTVAKNELAVTNLLLKILNPKKRILYYSVGHNEMSLFDKNQVGGDFLREKILNAGYELRPVELQKGIPKDASGVLILNPIIEFLDLEIQSLDKYLLKGGGLFVALAPHFNGIMINKFLLFLKEKGLLFYNGIILDRLADKQGSQASIPVINSYKKHKITNGLEGRTLFPISAFFQYENKEYVWDSLVESTPFPGSWGEFSFDEVKLGKAQFNEGIDSIGPLSILGIGENQKNHSRIVVSSSSSFLSNQFQGQTNNFNLFLNALSWGVKEESLMSLSRPGLDGNLVYISDIHLSFVFYSVILIFPFIFFGIGIYFYRLKLSC